MIEVSAGVVRNADGRVLLCRRQGALDGLWEFPGGKRESGESFAECLRRELMEELELPVTVGETLAEVTRTDGGREIKLVFLSAEINGDTKPCLHVHGKAEWVEVSRLGEYALCPGDRVFVDMGLL